VSFATPPILLALVALPLLIWWYMHEQRRREQAAAEFVTAPLIASVAPDRPGRRRHVPIAITAVAVAILIVAAAKPQRSVAVPVDDGAVILATDVSSSMAATDVAPSRLGAGQRAASKFLSVLPGAVRAGVLEFSVLPTVLQSPTTDRAATRTALQQLRTPAGHTAIGDAIGVAVRVLSGLRSAGGRRPPGAIVLLSDGTSTNGSDPLAAAKQAATRHIPIYTVALGTARGTIAVRHGTRTTTVPVPLSAKQLAQIAAASGGKAFSAADAGHLSAVYAHLATQLGHKHVKHAMTASFAGAGLVLLLAGAVLSLRWFARLV
jgi:Ca-activated chloride channel family protein